MVNIFLKYNNKIINKNITSKLWDKTFIDLIENSKKIFPQNSIMFLSDLKLVYRVLACHWVVWIEPWWWWAHTKPAFRK